MAGEQLERRAFCGWIGALGGVLGSGASARAERATRARPLELEFWIAGSRYHAPRGFHPGAGTPVSLQLGSQRGAPCFEIHAAAAGRIGYVPADLVPLLLRGRCLAARLARVEPDRSYRQFRVRVVLELS